MYYYCGCSIRVYRSWVTIIHFITNTWPNSSVTLELCLVFFMLKTIGIIDRRLFLSISINIKLKQQIPIPQNYGQYQYLVVSVSVHHYSICTYPSELSWHHLYVVCKINLVTLGYAPWHALLLRPHPPSERTGMKPTLLTYVVVNKCFVIYRITLGAVSHTYSCKCFAENKQF